MDQQKSNETTVERSLLVDYFYSKRGKFSIVTAVLFGFINFNAETVLGILNVFVILLGSVLLSLLFIDNLLGPVRKISDGKQYVKYLRSYYQRAVRASVVFTGLLILTYIALATEPYGWMIHVYKWKIGVVQVEGAFRIGWNLVLGGYLGFILKSYYELISQIVAIKFKI